MKTVKHCKVFVLVIMVAVQSLGNTNLIVVSGHSKHGPEDGVPPPLKTELLERAHKDATEYLSNVADYEQISSWQDKVYCEPVYNGSPNCYKGNVYSTASFILKTKIDDVWQVKTSSSRRWRCDIKYEEDIKQKVYTEALAKAKLYCNGDVVLPPNEVSVKEIPDNNWRGFFYTNYEATFQCGKYNRPTNL